MNRSSRLLEHGRVWLDWLKTREPLVLLAVLAIVAGLWVFVEIADEVLEGERVTLETRLIRAFRDPDNLHRPIGPVWMEETVRDITALGGVAVLLLTSGAVCGFLWLARKRRMALAVSAAVLGGMLASTLLKQTFERPRPDVVPPLVTVHSPSFPSGHSLMSAVVYLTLGALVATVVEGRRLKAYVTAVAMLLTLLIGLSRVYLGVHWPSDVLAGWTAGLVWALLCWLLIRLLQAEGQVEAEAGRTPAGG
ncbi:MAG TPA: phosphatase PAP2 family protein [Planctomycetaceae bacterium]|nr:phosphatase PAP2 family protein [Planctomycetaceae bacterium]